MSDMANVANGLAKEHPGMVRSRGRRAVTMDSVLSIGIFIFAVSAFVGLFVARNRSRVSKVQVAKIVKANKKLSSRTETV